MIDYEEDWLFPLLFKLRGSVYIRSFSFAFPSALLAFLILLMERQASSTYREEAGLMHHNSSVLWSAVTTVLVFMVGFRTRQGLSRFWEGTGLLHQMKGEWFDTVSNCVTFTIASAKKDPIKKAAVEQFRHTIVRLMSLCHGSALEEISRMSGRLETIDVMGLNSATLKHLKDCVDHHGFNKVEVLLHLVQSLITDAHEAGIIAIPPPILSRVYQTISRGYVNLLNTKKITDTKFPFPYVQLITFLLLLHTIMAPIAITSIIDHLVWAPIFTFVPVFGSHALNFIAIELEDPFGEDDNDLPLAHFQAEMNNCLLMLLHPNTDIIAGVSDKCIVNFEDLKNTVTVESHMGESHSHANKQSQRRTSIHLFDPSFKLIGSSKSNLEAVLAMAEKNKSLDQISGDDSGSQEGSDTFDMTTGPGLEVTTDPSAGGAPEHNDAAEALGCRSQMNGPGGRFLFPEPKLLHDKELDALLVKTMEDFNSSLQMWTAKMEEQVQDMANVFSAMGLSAGAGAPPPRAEALGTLVATPTADAKPGLQIYRDRVAAATGASSPGPGGGRSDAPSPAQSPAPLQQQGWSTMLGR